MRDLFVVCMMLILSLVTVSTAMSIRQDIMRTQTVIIQRQEELLHAVEVHDDLIQAVVAGVQGEW